MNDNEIKAANRKAMPRFLLLMAVSMLVGGALGYVSARYGLSALSGGIKSAGEFFGAHVAHWLMLTAAIAVPAACVPVYRGTKKLIGMWDGEDEEVCDEIDRRLSVVLWITGAALILSYFLIAAAYSGGFAAFEHEGSTSAFFIAIAAFFAIMIEAVVFQQKCVDAVKTVSPEKSASVYDMKFQKKWMDSCDEAEKIMIGKCAFKAYSATNTVCTVLSIALAICALIFGTGFLPSFAVCVVWLVNHSAYCREAVRYSKAGIKLS